MSAWPSNYLIPAWKLVENGLKYTFLHPVATRIVITLYNFARQLICTNLLCLICRTSFRQCVDRLQTFLNNTSAHKRSFKHHVVLCLTWVIWLIFPASRFCYFLVERRCRGMQTRFTGLYGRQLINNIIVWATKSTCYSADFSKLRCFFNK